MLRKFGIAVTLISFIFGGVIVIDLLIELAKLDNKGWDLLGRFFHHILIVYFLTMAMIGVFIGALIWGVYSQKVDKYYIIESILQKFFLIISTLWLGFILFYVLIA